MALNSVDAEYIATSMATHEAISLWKLSVALFGQRIETSMIRCDNKTCIRLSENHRSKHVDIRYHFIKNHVQHKIVQRKYIPIDEQVADILMKALGKVRFIFFRNKLGVTQNTFLAKREC